MPPATSPANRGSNHPGSLCPSASKGGGRRHFPFFGDFFFVATFAFFDAYDFVDAAFADAAFAAGRLLVV